MPARRRGIWRIAFLRTCYLAGGNPVGIEANLAYYGIGLMIFGVFNIVFFRAPMNRKTYSDGWAARRSSLYSKLYMVLPPLRADHDILQVFFPQFFKTAYKAGTAFIIAMIPATLGMMSAIKRIRFSV